MIKEIFFFLSIFHQGNSNLFFFKVSESGVHRPPVAGIHGIESDCAYSIVLSTGYGDVDHGIEFIYTGSGGRDLSGIFYCPFKALNQ